MGEPLGLVLERREIYPQITPITLIFLMRSSPLYISKGICLANQQFLVFLARCSGPEGTEVNSRGRALARSPRELSSKD